MRVGLTWLSRTQRRGNMPARQGFRPASGVSEVPKTSVQVGTGNRIGSKTPTTRQDGFVSSGGPSPATP